MIISYPKGKIQCQHCGKDILNTKQKRGVWQCWKQYYKKKYCSRYCFQKKYWKNNNYNYKENMFCKRCGRKIKNTRPKGQKIKFENYKHMVYCSQYCNRGAVKEKYFFKDIKTVLKKIHYEIDEEEKRKKREICSNKKLTREAMNLRDRLKYHYSLYMPINWCREQIQLNGGRIKW